MHSKLITAAVFFTMTAGIASADLMWDEAIDGDLSGDDLAPTQLYTKGVNNHVIFTTNDLDGVDREYFTFTVAEGYELVSIVLDGFETDPESNLGFIGVAEGNVFPTPASAPDVTSLLGYYLPGTSDIGNDIMQAMGNGGGSQGFSGPLGPGSYSFWVQETGPSVDNWDLNFIVTEIPAPSAIAVLGLAGLASRRRRS